MMYWVNLLKELGTTSSPRCLEHADEKYIHLKPSIVWWPVLPVPAILVAGLVAAAILLPQKIETNTRASAVAAARTTVGQFKTIRGYYTKNVI